MDSRGNNTEIGVPINAISQAENIEFMKKIYDNTIDLIYIDPPFYTQKDFDDFDDRWNTMDDYLEFMKKRLIHMHRILSKCGTIYLHCDHHAAHYLKVIMDDIFGMENFQVEIVWKRYFQMHRENMFSNITDFILLYTKSDDFTYNPIKIAKRETEERYSKIEPETGRRFRTTPIIKSGDTNHTLDFNRRTVTLPDNRRFVWSQERLDKELKKNPNCIYWSDNGIPRYKTYLDEFDGTRIMNLWTDINAVANHSEESVGYMTQKPEELLKRIIYASSNEWDVVADFFCGSGTTPAVAKKMRRKYIGCDINHEAVEITKKRLENINVYKNISDYMDTKNSDDTKKTIEKWF